VVRHFDSLLSSGASFSAETVLPKIAPWEQLFDSGPSEPLDLRVARAVQRCDVTNRSARPHADFAGCAAARCEHRARQFDHKRQYVEPVRREEVLRGAVSQPLPCAVAGVVDAKLVQDPGIKVRRSAHAGCDERVRINRDEDVGVVARRGKHVDVGEIGASSREHGGRMGVIRRHCGANAVQRSVPTSAATTPSKKEMSVEA